MKTIVNSTSKKYIYANGMKYRYSHGSFIGEVESLIGSRPECLDLNAGIVKKRLKTIKSRYAKIKDHYLEVAEEG